MAENTKQYRVGNYPRTEDGKRLAPLKEGYHYSYPKGTITRPKLRPAAQVEEVDIQRPASAIELIQMEKIDRLQQYASLGMKPSQLKIAADNFDKVRIDAAMQVMVDEAFKQKISEIIPHVKAGSFENLKVSKGLYNSVAYLHHAGMSFQDIGNELSKRHTAAINAEEAVSRAANTQAIANEKALSGEATRAMVIGDDAAFDKAIIKLQPFNAKAAATLVKEYADAGNNRLSSTSDAIDFLDGKGIELSFGHLKEMLKNLSNEDRKKYLDVINTYEDREFIDAKTIIAGEMEISVRIQDMAADDPNLARHKVFSKIIGKLQRAQTMAARKGENFDAIAVGDSLVSEMFTEHQAIEIAEVKRKATSYIGQVNASNLEGTGRLLSPTDFPAAQAYFEGVLTKIEANTAVDEFTKDNIGKVKIFISQMIKAQQNE